MFSGSSRRSAVTPTILALLLSFSLLSCFPERVERLRVQVQVSGRMPITAPAQTEEVFDVFTDSVSNTLRQALERYNLSEGTIGQVRIDTITLRLDQPTNASLLIIDSLRLFVHNGRQEWEISSLLTRPPAASARSINLIPSQPVLPREVLLEGDTLYFRSRWALSDTLRENWRTSVLVKLMLIN